MTRLLIATLCAATLAGCATGSATLTLARAQDAAELAFSGLDLATNTALAGGIKGPAEHKLRVDYETAHAALLAMRAGTGSATAALNAIAATKPDLPPGAPK